MRTTVSKILRFGAFAAAAAGLSTGAQASVLADGGFETQGATIPGGGVGYCYFGGDAGNAVCGAGAWTGTSGFLRSNALNWPGIPSVDGSTYYGFIQGSSYLSQAFTVSTAGSYLLSWSEAGRFTSGNTNGQQQYVVKLTDVGANATITLYTGSTANFQNWLARSANATLGTGNYVLTFQGTAATDSTAFIDAVSLSSAVPEPGTWVLMAAGIGLAGFALRRRPAQRPAAA